MFINVPNKAERQTFVVGVQQKRQICWSSMEIVFFASFHLGTLCIIKGISFYWLILSNGVTYPKGKRFNWLRSLTPQGLLFLRGQLYFIRLYCSWKIDSILLNSILLNSVGRSAIKFLISEGEILPSISPSSVTFAV